MKQTEIGMIPDDWEVVNINNYCSIKARIGWQGLKSDEYLDIGDYILVTGTDFDNGYINWKSCNYVSEWRFKQDRNIQIRENDILVTKDGTIGKVACIKNLPMQGTLNSGVFVVRPKNENKLDAIFLSRIFKSFWFDSFLAQITAGSTIVHLYQKDFIKFNFPVPSKNEQQKIAKALSDVDNVISTLEKLITKKKNLKQGTMQQLLTGKKRLPGFAKSDKFKLTEIGEIPEDWEVKELGDVGSFSKGSAISREDADSGDIPAIRYGEVYTHHDNYIKAFYSHISEAVSKKAKKLSKGDLLFTCSGETKEDIGKCVAFIGDEEAYAGGDLLILSPSMEIDSLYFGFLLNSDFCVKQKASFGQGDAVVHISSESIKKLVIPIPSKPEQTAIANVLSSMDKEIEALETKLGKYRNLKTGMMQQLLTGKIRLR